MSLGIPSFRLTSDDLPDADRKTKRALEPLLSALSLVLNAVVSALNSLAVPKSKETSFTTDANGSAYVGLGLGTPAKDVWVTGLVPKDGTLHSAWAMSWIPQPAGARLLFVGLAMSATYNVRVLYL